MEVHLTPTVVIAALACLIAALGFMLAVTTAIGGLVVKAVRHQSKTDAQGDEIIDLNKSCADLKARFFNHETKNEIHFDREKANLVEKNRDAEIARIREDVTEIKGVVKALAERK